MSIFSGGRMAAFSNPAEIAKAFEKDRNLSIISTDLFDTIVYRDVWKPEDLFRVHWSAIADFLPQVRDWKSWVRIRKETEHALAKRAAPAEIELKDVYEAIARDLNLSSEVVAAVYDAELELERKLISPYGDVVEVLRALHAQGVKVVVLTDTYLPPDFIRSLVDGILGFEADLRCSSETGEPKRTGLAFKRLASDFGPNVLHIGDNPEVDVRMARRHGVKCHLVAWGRQEWIRGEVNVLSYAAALGSVHAVTPHAEPSEKPETFSQRELAVRWAYVLSDFVLSVRSMARSHDITDVWLLSRDCESIAEGINSNPSLFDGLDVKYVFASRAATHPVMAVKNPKKFSAWRSRAVTSEDLEAGSAAIEYYQSLLTAPSRRILLVDMGWKGRLQEAIAAAVPQHHVEGFYFSLEPDAARSMGASAGVFVNWDPDIFNQAVVEALAGYRDASCAAFEKQSNGTVGPRFLQNGGADTSPAEYCETLRSGMKVILNSADIDALAEASVSDVRRRMIRSICQYPDRGSAAAFSAWDIGVQVDGSDARPLLLSPDRLHDRLACRPSPKALWPRGAAWTISQNPRIVRAIHSYADAVTSLRRSAGRLRRQVKRTLRRT